MADIVTLKKRRAYIKGMMTKMVNYINTIDENPNIEEIKVRLSSVERYRTSFAELEDKIVSVDASEELDTEFEENYFKIVAGLNHVLRNNSEPTVGFNETINDSSTAGIHADVKLPKISIPSFYGDYTDWQSFHDLFCSTIHDNNRLTPSQKLQYLKGTLKGEASSLLKHFSITDANYIEALTKLRERYDRKRHTVYAFIKNFMVQPAVTTANSVNVRRLLDTSDEIIRGLKALGGSAESRDHWLIHIMTNKLDEETNNLWAQTSAEYNLPTIKQFFEFLGRRIDALETLKSQNKRPQINFNQPKSVIKSHAISSSQSVAPCSICSSENHRLFECDKFKQLTVIERKAFLTKENRCFNCLNDNHNVYTCKSRFRCRQCNRKHHTLLHGEIPNQQASVATVSKSEVNEASSTSFTTNTHMEASILPTALVCVLDELNQNQYCRALLDSGSQSSFITENCAQRLKLKRSYAKLAVTGIGGGTNGYTKGSVSLTFTPWSKTEPRLQIQAFVYPKLTKRTSISHSIDFEVLKQYELADPDFHKNLEIDIIIGVDTYFDLLADGKIINTNQFKLQKTLLGWIVAGKSEGKQSTQSLAVNLTNTEENLDKLLTRFWEIESIQGPQNKLSQEEQFCEDYFQETKNTDNMGRFKVRLPFKQSPSLLGDSYRVALQRMHSIEKKFLRDPEFKSMYQNFISEYIELKHMKPITEKEERAHGYFLPHHGVIKNSSSTTKLRVVFDGSAKSSTGKSLNDCLAVGPNIQSHLYDILLRFRTYRVAFTADVEKMFRQIQVAEDETRFQRILWRNNVTESLRTYELQTVTYGTASATYLATRALNESTANYHEAYPEAVDQIKNNMYVDDLMGGADSIERAMKLKHEVDTILSSSGFQLRKWLSNEERVLTQTTQSSNSSDLLEIEDSNSVKVLGLYWNPTKDCFQFQVNLNDTPNVTKRAILSEASRLFDPLGWLAPVTITIKIFFQSLWIENLKWDDKLPTELATKWAILRNNLPKLQEIQIPRYIGTVLDRKIALHGFSDASKHAYSAVVYGQIINENGNSIIRLISAKTKVAPVKQISIPRLELCGALLLNNLLLAVQKALQCKITNITAWTDSTIVLDWLSAHPTKWNTFVGNRTGEILANMNRSQWRHVDSHNNPADCASRGIEVEKLQESKLWWNGPNWLASPETWPRNTHTQLKTTEEIRSHTINLEIQQHSILDKLTKRISSFNKIIKILAYVFRYINLKLKRVPQTSITPYLLNHELHKPRSIIFNYMQSTHFESELRLISSNKELSSTSKLKQLKPFIDDSGLLRVGGRIANAAITYDIKYPIILPAKDHLQYLHAGETLMMATLRKKYWILGCRQLVKNVIYGCMRCERYAGRNLNQIMGDLPNQRVELVRPFFKVGVDYAGPFQTCPIRGRGQKTRKSYICIFVCLATKAVHIELVSDLTTEAYIAALRRFIARRGICKEIHSDNGTNFIGARSHLNELFKFIKQNSNAFSNFLLTDEITLKFIPPSAPHFGGLWEAAVKRVKYHLRRVTNGHIITFEEMTTLLAEIEAMLNSRPICNLSSDELDYLTPGHFLIGRPTTQLPSDDLADIKVSKLSRWQMIQQMNQNIWRRWYLEYLTSLQNRNKWNKKQNNIKTDDIVLIKENNLPPSKWLLGKVIQLHPGADKIIRVVTLKTSSGIVKRPIHKLCLLPVN